MACASDACGPLGRDFSPMNTYRIFYAESPRANVASGSMDVRAQSAASAEFRAGERIVLAAGFDGAPKRWILRALTVEIPEFAEDAMGLGERHES
jgi:hypothetical protein